MTHSASCSPHLPCLLLPATACLPDFCYCLLLPVCYCLPATACLLASFPLLLLPAVRLHTGGVAVVACLYQPLPHHLSTSQPHSSALAAAALTQQPSPPFSLTVIRPQPSRPIRALPPAPLPFKLPPPSVAVTLTLTLGHSHSHTDIGPPSML